MKKTASFVCIAALLLTACQTQELLTPTTETVQLIFGDNPTKANVNGENGVTTWTTGDEVAIYISGAGANAYQTKTVNGGVIPVSLTSTQTRTNFAVYPAASKVDDYVSSSDLRLTYPTEYNLSGKSASEMAIFSPMPMVAANNTSGALTFYNVGGVLRLTINNVPATTKYIKVTVPGMQINGTFTVDTPASTSPSVTTTTGSGESSYVTFQLAESTIGSLGNYTLNLPLPAGDYSGVTDDIILVEALDATGASTIAKINGSVSRWGTISRRKGKKLTVDFAPSSFAIYTPAATLWKGETTTYATTHSGLITWSSSNTAVATINSSTGEITAVAAGESTITATLNGQVVSPGVKVYVNAVTGITITAAKATILPSTGSTTVTATLSHSTNGSIESYPSVTFTSGSSLYVKFGSSSGTATTSVSASETATPGEATASTTVYAASGSTEGYSSYITAAAGGLTTSPGVTITLSEPFPVFYNGFLFRNTNTATFKSATYVDATSDPLILLQYCGASNYYKMFFTWNELATIAVNGGTNESFETASIITIGGNTYHIAKRSEYEKLYSASRSNTITVGSTVHSNKKYSVVHVNLTGTAYAGKGYSATSENTSANLITGILFYPDGITASTDASLTSFDTYGSTIWTTTSTNSLTLTQLSELVNDGCIFLPALGSRYGSSWYGRGINALYWSSTYNSNGSSASACILYFRSSDLYTTSTNRTNYIPVLLVQDN